MKFNVGDEVTIREDLSRDEYNVVSDMEEYRGQVATITDIRSYGNYLIDLDDGYWYWDEHMFEEGVEKKVEENTNKVDDTEKFRAFLNEVARGDSANDEYYEMYSNLSDVVTVHNDDYSNDEVNTLIDELVKFYSNFEPKPTPKSKKMTLKEIEEKLGYKVEIVED